ncbi:MAG: DUF1934 domain-containing protein [Acutalibacteraceae bacterium]
MEKKQKIKIISSQYAEDDKETIIAHTEAVVSGESDDYTITYIETQGDLVGEKTSLRVRNGRKVSISRKSPAFSSLIIIERGIRHITHYSNSGLSFNMGISCSELVSDFEGGRLYFRYETDMDLVPIGEIEFEFIFRKTEDL